MQFPRRRLHQLPHLPRLPERHLQVPQVRERQILQIQILRRRIGLQPLRGRSQRVRAKPRPRTERGRPVPRHPQQGRRPLHRLRPRSEEPRPRRGQKINRHAPRKQIPLHPARPKKFRGGMVFWLPLSMAEETFFGDRMIRIPLLSVADASCGSPFLRLPAAGGLPGNAAGCRANELRPEATATISPKPQLPLSKTQVERARRAVVFMVLFFLIDRIRRILLSGRGWWPGRGIWRRASGCWGS